MDNRTQDGIGTIETLADMPDWAIDEILTSHDWSDCSAKDVATAIAERIDLDWDCRVPAKDVFAYMKNCVIHHFFSRAR
jgi:hypothetical protein